MRQASPSNMEHSQHLIPLQASCHADSSMMYLFILLHHSFFLMFLCRVHLNPFKKRPSLLHTPSQYIQSPHLFLFQHFSLRHRIKRLISLIIWFTHFYNPSIKIYPNNFFSCLVTASNIPTSAGYIVTYFKNSVFTYKSKI